MSILHGTPIKRKAILIFENLLFKISHWDFFGKGVTMFGLPIISFAPGSQVTIGKDVVMISHSYFSEPGVDHPDTTFPVP